MKPHIWTMDRQEANIQAAMAMAGYKPTIAPHCRHCGVDSVTAQRLQPQNQGVGPCPLAGDWRVPVEGR